ncbi:MAG: AAA family ATPase [Chloroflexota bacterium]
MITSVRIQNYRSIVEATVELSPFTLLIGANGTGKSNFLQLFEDIRDVSTLIHKKHFNHLNKPQKITIQYDNDTSWEFSEKHEKGFFPLHYRPTIFRLNPDSIGKAETLSANPQVSSDGSGAVQVLDSLKTGAHEDLFELIENDLKRYVPEIEKLFFIPSSNAKQLQVREKSIVNPILVQELSEGTRLALTILTIVYQENPPLFIGLEEIDRGLHPRLFQQIIELLTQISEEKGIQIVATTHNPYLVDEFKDREESVIIVEKHEGATTFTSLSKKLENLEPYEEPLGQLWYSGIAGGVPAFS